MPTISLCMVVKNEEEVLARCLNSAREITDEIIVVDAGSADRTKEIAKEYTDKIYDFTWTDDFSAARNFSFAQATGEYILWLDADDVILDADKSEFLRLKEELDCTVDVVMMRYTTDTDENGQPNFFYYVERLVKKSSGFLWKEPAHEYLEFEGNIRTSDIRIVHKNIHKNESGRNLAIYESVIAKGEELSPRGLYHYARELMEHGKTKEAVEAFSRFLDTGKGPKEDNINACYALSGCYSILNDTNLALLSLYRSFLFDLPRPEACCRIGFAHLNSQEYKKAIFWFDLATKLPVSPGCKFMHPDYSDYIPFMELAVCYDRLGDYEKSEAFNCKAGELKPGAPEVLYNKKYFAALKNSGKYAV